MTKNPLSKILKNGPGSAVKSKQRKTKCLMNDIYWLNSNAKVDAKNNVDAWQSLTDLVKGWFDLRSNRNCIENINSVMNEWWIVMSIVNGCIKWVSSKSG